MLKAKKIDCTFRADDSLKELKLPMEIRRNFYLIFKESINNIYKYADCTTLGIHIECRENKVSMTITDNGKGFDLSKKNERNGINNINNVVLQ